MYQLNPALRDFWQTKSDGKVLYGGRASSKSHDAGGFSIHLASNWGLRFMCARQFQNKINESVYTLLCNKISEHPNRNDFQILNNAIVNKRTKAEFLFYGLARNIEEVKSTEGVDILWMEEGHALKQRQWEILEPTIRKEGSECWMIFNPDLITDFAYQRFVVTPPANYITRLINYDENPFLSEKMVRMIDAAYEEDPDSAAHIYGGQPRTDSDLSVINLKFIMAAVDAHTKISNWPDLGLRRVGYDVADSGVDKNATVFNENNIIRSVDEWKGLEDELLKSASRVYNQARDLNAEVHYDTIGMGAGIGSKFKELNENNEGYFQLNYDAFNADGALDRPDDIYIRLPHKDILNKEYFSNLKAQKWVEAGERFRKTYEVLEKGARHSVKDLISIDSKSIPKDKLQQLMFELSTPRKDTDLNGRFKVESKKDLKKRDIKSPNVADAAIMAIAKPVRKGGGFFS